MAVADSARIDRFVLVTLEVTGRLFNIGADRPGNAGGTRGNTPPDRAERDDSAVREAPPAFLKASHDREINNRKSRLGRPARATGWFVGWGHTNVTTI